MQFSTKEDVEAPIEYVFSQLTDFDGFERAALRRGAEVERASGDASAAVGTAWKGRAEFRGKERSFTAEIAKCDPPNDMELRARSDGFDINVVVELVALSPNRTRMRIAVELKPRILSARLVMQSARLAKHTLTKRYKERIKNFSLDLDARYQRSKA